MQIARALDCDPRTNPMYKGVYACDQIPAKGDLTGSCAIVINTDDSKKRGSHWIAVIIEKGDTIELFDSFGRHPTELGADISRFYETYENKTYNSIRFQSHDTLVCGAYCLYYIMMKRVGWSLDVIQFDLILKGKLWREELMFQEMCKWTAYA